MEQEEKKPQLLVWRVSSILITLLLMLSGNGNVTALGNPNQVQPQKATSALEFTVPWIGYNFNTTFFPSSEPYGLILHDQYGAFSTTLAISQNYDDSHNSLDTEIADDFIVPEGDFAWTVESIDIFGACRKGTAFDCGSLSSANVRIYADAGIIPGSLIYSAMSQTVVSADLMNSGPLRQYVVKLSSPLLLTPGSYWISIQVNMDYAIGDWGWMERTIQTGDWHVFRNPGGGWNEGCQTWCSGHRNWPDLAFRINGNFGGNYKEIINVESREVYDVVEHGSQPLIYASVPGNNSILVINTNNASIQATIPVVSPGGLAISQDSSKLFVSSWAVDLIQVIDTSTNMVVNSFPLSYFATPHGIAIGNDGYLYTPESSFVTVRNSSTGAYIGSLPNDLFSVRLLEISSNGQFLCAAIGYSDHSRIACYDISKGIPTTASSTNFNLCSAANYLDISSDGERVYLVCGGSPQQVKVLATNTLMEINQFNIGNYPVSMLDFPDGKVLFGSSADGVRSFDPNSNLPVGRLDNAQVKLLETGRDNHTIYGVSDWNIFIYHFGNFQDVNWKYWARPWIERLYSAGITGGCGTSPLRYCASASVTRAQMAVFLERGKNGSSFIPPAATGTTFGDIASNHWAAAWIEQLATDGITAGCSGGNYCPETVVTRAQMAVLLLRAIHGSDYVPPEPTGVFTDVPTTNWAAAWIEQLATEGITSGCGSGIYCPNAPVTRAQMAVFLVKAFNLP